MKKIYLSILAGMFTCQFANAQLTLTKAGYEPVLGDIEIRSGRDSAGVVPKNTGTNQTWNFSTLTTNTVNSSLTYTTVASTPSASAFPLATLADSDGSGAYTYYRSSGSNWEMLGQVDTASGVFINFSGNPSTMVTWPVSYGYNGNDVFSGTAAVSSFSGTAGGTINVQGTGTGTVMLPGGYNFSNALQLKIAQTITLNLAGGLITGTITSLQYQYYSSAYKFPILTVNYSTSNVGGTPSSSADITVNAAIYLGINEGSLEKANIVFYPNPATDQLNVMLKNEKSENVAVEIMNGIGQAVKNVSFGNEAQINQAIDLSGLNSGIYFVKTTIGEKSVSKKLIIQ